MNDKYCFDIPQGGSKSLKRIYYCMQPHTKVMNMRML